MIDQRHAASGSDSPGGNNSSSSRPARPQPLKTPYSANPSLRPPEMSSQSEGQEWWNHPGHPVAETPVFDAIDDRVVVAEIKKKLQDGELPMLEIPSNIMQTLKLLDNPDFSFAEVATLVQRSPAMAGEFLKVINSSFYGSGRAIRDLKIALPRLGKVKVKSLLYIYSASMNFSGNKIFNGVAVDVVEHSYAVGMIASYLSQRFFPDPDLAFLTGLLHDIGKLAIIKTITETHKLPSKLDFTVTEDVFLDIFPELHEKVGIYIAEHWTLDKNVTIAIGHHHDCQVPRRDCADFEQATNLCNLIMLSDLITRILGKGRPVYESVDIFDLPAAKAIRLDRNWSNIEFINAIPGMVNFHLDR